MAHNTHSEFPDRPSSYLRNIFLHIFFPFSSEKLGRAGCAASGRELSACLSLRPSIHPSVRCPTVRPSSQFCDICSVGIFFVSKSSARRRQLLESLECKDVRLWTVKSKLNCLAAFKPKGFHEFTSYIICSSYVQFINHVPSEKNSIIFDIFHFDLFSEGSLFFNSSY